MALINSVISWVMKKRIHQIELFMKYPHDVQDEWLTRLIDRGRQTEYGKLYDFGSIKNYRQFSERVPLNNYNSLKPYVDRLRKGEQNLLWPSETKWFAKSSGTTAAKSKYIPVTKESLEDCHFNGGKDLLSIYVNNHPDTLIFDGRSIAMGGSHNITEVNNEEYYEGDLSAILIQNLPFWAQILRTPNLEIALMDEWESKIEKMAWNTMQHNVTTLSGVPSWTMLLMKKVLDISGKEYLKEIWPNLELFVHGGVKFEPYRQQFHDLVGPVDINYQESYNASEGFFGIQDRTDSKEILLMLDYGIYYEFIPMKEIEKEHPKVLPLREVEVGVNYAMLITTNAGLWRYEIGDTIEFTSTEPYRFIITGRTKYFINLVGEEIILDNAVKALDIACKKCQVEVDEYMAGPSSSDKENMHHEWLIEFVSPPANPSVFVDALDNALKSLNSDYEAKRYKNLLLKTPVLRILKPGTFYQWLKGKGKLGGQHKVPRLVNKNTFIQEILQLGK
jgi:hypothetical protein